MNNELDMYMEQVRTFKMEIAVIDQDMRKVSKKWIKKQAASGGGNTNNANAASTKMMWWMDAAI